MDILPAAEFEVMNVLWSENHALTTRQIVDAVADTREWKIQTVATLLGRLTKRGFVAEDREMRQIRYLPLVKREDYVALETRDLATRHKGAALTSLVAAFADQGDLSQGDLEELSVWLQKQIEKTEQ